MKRVLAAVALAGAMAMGGGAVNAQVPAPGPVKGHDLAATPDNLERVWAASHVVLPASLTGAAPYDGMLTPMPEPKGRSPVVILMHGSSGINDQVKAYQTWLAEALNLPSIAPDSFAIPDRLSYTSPQPVALYERVHALRLAELENALFRAMALPWVDPDKIIVVGTSEGSVAVARLLSPRPIARIIYSWSCEKNYFVAEPRNAVPSATPVLNVISTEDPFFSAKNPWNKGYQITGDCAAGLANHRDVQVTRIVGKEHTILNRPAAREATEIFLRRVLGRGS